MRDFIYFSNKARTSGNFSTSDLMKAGRMDIAIHVLINAFFLSHKIRTDTKLHLIFNGPPSPPAHLELFPGNVIPETGKQAGKNQPDISKKDVANLIKKMLYKLHKEKTEVWPGYTIEKKSLFKTIDQLIEEGKEIYILDAKGEDIRKIKLKNNSVFVLADQDGFPKKELKKLKTLGTPIRVGKQTYFASQVITIVNNEIDRQGI
ncbi:MAG: tRNA (pseudouridine(54)-N(1))-methyltransferase TrmY [Nanoarchaeota archaeon]|nr:tRNA (pseudouridine(54)-N(1))-methyltransferase TrmY [Nanoarchaeota archaeon]